MTRRSVRKLTVEVDLHYLDSLRDIADSAKEVMAYEWGGAPPKIGPWTRLQQALAAIEDKS